MKPAEFLRTGWKFYRFGNIAKFSRELFQVEPTKNYRELSLRLFGNGFELRREVAGASLVAYEMQRLRVGQLVTSIHQFRNGAVGIVPPEFEGAVLSKNFLVYDLDQAVVDASFLLRFLTAPSSISFFQANSTGSATPIFPKVMIEDVEIPLPPLAEQRRVVGRIKELAAQIHEARTLRHQATEQAEMLVDRATSHLLDEKGWKTRALAEILAESPRNGLAPQPQAENGNRGMLRINAVSSTPTRFVDMVALKQVNVPDEVARPFVVQNDDVFIVRYNGDINRVAKPAIYKGENTSRIVYPDKLMRLRPDRAKMAPDFLVFALGARSVREQIEEMGKTTAGNIGVSGANAKSFRVPIPPLAEQHRIVAELDALQGEVDALKRLQAETAAELDALLPSILDRAFKGEL